MLREKLTRYMHVWRQTLTFFNAELGYYAASLSFYTIFAFIPLLLIALSITTRLPWFEEYFEDLQKLILEHLLPANVESANLFLENMLGDISRLGLMGAIYVIVTSILFFKNYQHIASHIFRSPGRGFWDSLTTYWTLMTLLPLGLTLSLYLTTRAQMTLASSSIIQGVDLTLLAPYIITWLAFGIVFRISANKPMKGKHILITSLITSIVWGVTKELFVAYAVFNKAYTTVYGSFSILLLLLLWVYISWIIVLFGMRLCEGFHVLFEE